MPLSYPFVMVDRSRAEQFALSGYRRGLFTDRQLITDRVALTYAYTQIGRHGFGVAPWGPGWLFDLHARGRRALPALRLRRNHAFLNECQRVDQIDRVLSDLRFGKQLERLLWTIHQHILQSGQSVIRIPDVVFATALWGSEQYLPSHWRSEINKRLHTLSLLHVMELSEGEQPILSSSTAMLTHFADLRGSENDICIPECPIQNLQPHHHYAVTIGSGFLGVLEQFNSADESNPVRMYEFPIRGRNQGSTLASVGRTGQLATIFLPAKLGDPVSSKRLSNHQLRLLQALIRETTRQTRKKRQQTTEAETFVGQDVPQARVERRGESKKFLPCPLLSDGEQYIGFNGNKKLKGRGYRLCTEGGWLAKAGYEVGQLDDFLTDLKGLANELNLVVVGLHPKTNEWSSLDAMQRLNESVTGRVSLRRLHVRIYTKADYAERWSRFFGWAVETPVQEAASFDASKLARQLRDRQITRRAMSEGIGIDASLLSKILTGKRPCSTEFYEQAQCWLDEYENVENAVPMIGSVDCPPIVLNGSMLECALGYHGRGWSIIPQKPGTKRPYVKWKNFQLQPPAGDKVRNWWTQWPNAGVALIAGPVSQVLVIDVDGREAHDVLVDRLGEEPLAPKVFSGSGDPYRYHLFFQHPDFRTKAKATPWHDKLEFRGHRGLAVLPPSLHKSGIRYVWARGQSLDDLAIPALPEPIRDALKPRETSPPVAPPQLQEIESIDASTSTLEFLSGRWSLGPRWNERLFNAACDLNGRGILRELAEPLLLQGAAPKDDTELENARRTIESAYSEPRDAGQI